MDIICSEKRTAYASINSSGAHAPPGQPRGICSRCQPGGGAFANFIAARGLGISVPQGNAREFGTRACFRKMDEFIGKDEPKLPAEG